ncbi:MAG: hypothetical protein ABIO41_03980 [Ignavibacteria bacterium]
MDIINIDEKKLYEIVKNAVSEAVREELINCKLNSIPFVNDDEMEEIERDLSSKTRIEDQDFKEIIIKNR